MAEKTFLSLFGHFFSQRLSCTTKNDFLHQNSNVEILDIRPTQILTSLSSQNGGYKTKFRQFYEKNEPKLAVIILK